MMAVIIAIKFKRELLGEFHLMTFKAVSKAVGFLLYC